VFVSFSGRASVDGVSSSLILASRSPQRRAILEQLGIEFEIRVAEIDELEDGDPQEIALANARRKARAIDDRGAAAAVLGVDTIVALDGRIYGKPADSSTARATLRALSGRRHEVVSGLCLIGSGPPRAATAVTAVEFRPLTDQLIEWYVETGEWRDRAGGYAIQGKGAALVTRIDGDYLNVVGLPVAALLELEPGLLTA
jgi:septum formation protein